MDLAAVHDWILGLSSQPLRLSQAKTLAWLVVSLIQTQKLTLASLAQNARAKTSFKHKLKRVFRFFANHSVEPEIAFKPFARKLLKRRKKRLIVAMDWTETNGLHTLALVASFGSRSVPLLWTTMKCKYKKQTQTEKRLLETFAGWLPKKAKVVILADRGFGKTDLAKHCDSLGLDYLIHIKPDVHVKCQRYSGLLRKYEIQPGRAHVLRNVEFRKKDPVALQVVVKAKANTTWFLITSLPGSAQQLTKLYSKRMSIEETFRDCKSVRSGFSLSSTQIQTAQHFDRLLLAVSLALVLLCGLGLKAKTMYPPSYWSSNKRENEQSVLTIARRMLHQSQIPPNQAVKALKEELDSAYENWG